MEDKTTEKEELKARLKVIEDEEKQDRIDAAYPEFKLYIGKCFKMRNSYGSFDHWWLYRKVISLNPEDLYLSNDIMMSHCTTVEFQMDSHGLISFTKKDHGYAHSLGDEISKEEFDTEFNKMVQSVTKLRKL